MKKHFLHSTFYIPHSIFKRSIAVLILLILSVFLGAPTAFAAENEKLRVYYSEPIGAGEKVYHLTACNWVRAYEPLVCSEENAEKYSAQCKYKEGDKKDKVKKGTKIMGCTTEGEYEDDEAKMYLKADVGKYDSGDKACKDDPTLQGYKYAPAWAIVKVTYDENSKKIIGDNYGTISSQEEPSQDLIDKISNSQLEADAYPFFKTNSCVTWDALLDSKEPDPENTSQKTLNIMGLIGVKPGDTIVNDLITEGCNNDNSKEALPITINGEASPKPLVHCSLVERITGDTGTDIFSQYVGALYKWAAGIVGIVTVLIMVASGIQISMAGGDSAKIDSAKNRIMQSIIGLVILFLAGLILYTINPGFFTG